MTQHMCYVFREGDEFAGVPFDEKWARMMDFENNMRDDQADEITAGTYARETGYPDEYMRAHGLLRNESRSKRGIFIGRHARTELWTLFANGKVTPKDAQIICEMTRSIKDESRINDIQGRCAALLAEGKSWEYIGAVSQLLANKEAVTMHQGLLDLGADFEADMGRMARWIELNLRSLNESISLLNGEKKRAKKGDKASRLGLSATMTAEQREKMLADLNTLKAQFELIGSYPDLVAQAQMWDGDESRFTDPVELYLDRAQQEREQQARESAMPAEDYLEEQARKEAAEATPMLFSMSLDSKLRENVALALAHRLKSTTEVRVSNCPWLLWFFGERAAELVTWARNLSKMANDHELSAEQIISAFEKMSNPEFLIKDTENSYIFIPGGLAYNKQGNLAEIEVPVQLERTPDGNHFVVSAYPLEKLQKIESLFKRATLIYSKRSKAELSTNGVPDGLTQDFIRLVVKFGFTDNTITLSDIVNENRADISHSVLLEHRRQMDAVKAAALADGTFMKAPNGKPSNLTERQWCEVRTPAFKAWFGDWEKDPANASKVLDENGEPLVVYHFTDSVFTAFDVSKARQNADIPAIFFSSGTEDWADMGSRVMPCYLNIRNPKEGKPIVRSNGREVRDALVAEGYDGTIDRDEDVEEVEYAAFRPEQVKSATDNRGTYSSATDDISMSVTEEAADSLGGMLGDAGGRRVVTARLCALWWRSCGNVWSGRGHTVPRRRAS